MNENPYASPREYVERRRICWESLLSAVFVELLTIVWLLNVALLTWSFFLVVF